MALIKAFNEFNTTDFGALLGKGAYFTANESEARQYSGQGTRIVPAYLSIKKKPLLCKIRYG